MMPPPRLDGQSNLPQSQSHEVHAISSNSTTEFRGVRTTETGVTYSLKQALEVIASLCNTLAHQIQRCFICLFCCYPCCPDRSYLPSRNDNTPSELPAPMPDSSDIGHEHQLSDTIQHDLSDDASAHEILPSPDQRTADQTPEHCESETSLPVDTLNTGSVLPQEEYSPHLPNDATQTTPSTPSVDIDEYERRNSYPSGETGAVEDNQTNLCHTYEEQDQPSSSHTHAQLSLDKHLTDESEHEESEFDSDDDGSWATSWYESDEEEIEAEAAADINTGQFMPPQHLPTDPEREQFSEILTDIPTNISQDELRAIRSSAAYIGMIKVFIAKLGLAKRLAKKPTYAIDTKDVRKIIPYPKHSLLIKYARIEKLQTTEQNFCQLCTASNFIRISLECAAKDPELFKQLAADSNVTLYQINQKFPLHDSLVQSERISISSQGSSTDSATTQDLESQNQQVFEKVRQIKMASRKRVVSRSPDLSVLDLKSNQQIAEDMILKKVERYYLLFIDHLIASASKKPKIKNPFKSDKSEKKFPLPALRDIATCELAFRHLDALARKELTSSEIEDAIVTTKKTIIKTKEAIAKYKSALPERFVNILQNGGHGQMSLPELNTLLRSLSQKVPARHSTMMET